LNLGGDLQVEDFTGSVQLNRTPQGIVALGDFFAQIPAECARCLKPFAAPVNIRVEDLFIYPPQNATDPLLAIGEDAHLNLEPLLREYILISQPTRPLCREDCRGLCPVCGADLNEEPDHRHEEEPAGLFPERMLVRASGERQKPLAPAAAPVAVPAADKTAPAGQPAGRKKTVRRKTAPKTKAQRSPGRKKSPAGKKSAGGGKKKTSTKK
jgi:uncharacterized metal-binding protein YceD (DUF177 family)